MENKTFEYNFDRIYNVLDYTFNNPALLEQAFIRKSAESEYFDSNEELIIIGKQIVDVILSKKKYIYNSEDNIKELKKLLWIPIASFDLLEFVYCSKEEIEETFNSKDVKIEIFYAIFGAIVVDSDWDFKVLEKVFDTIYTTNLELLNEMINRNYMYDIRRYMKESTFDEYYEKYIIRDNNEFELMLATEGYILKSFNDSIFEIRYSLCKFMYEYLIDCGLVRQIKKTEIEKLSDIIYNNPGVYGFIGKSKDDNTDFAMKLANNIAENYKDYIYVISLNLMKEEYYRRTHQLGLLDLDGFSEVVCSVSHKENLITQLNNIRNRVCVLDSLNKSNITIKELRDLSQKYDVSFIVLAEYDKIRTINDEEYYTNIYELDFTTKIIKLKES